MYTLLHTETVRKELLRELPALTVSVTLAEFFFRFHSFALECVAFLVTWYAASYTVSRFLQWDGKRVKVHK